MGTDNYSNYYLVTEYKICENQQKWLTDHEDLV